MPPRAPLAFDFFNYDSLSKAPKTGAGGPISSERLGLDNIVVGVPGQLQAAD